VLGRVRTLRLTHRSLAGDSTPALHAGESSVCSQSLLALGNKRTWAQWYLEVSFPCESSSWRLSGLSPEAYSSNGTIKNYTKLHRSFFRF